MTFRRANAIIINGTAAWRLGHSHQGGDAMVTYEGLFALGMLILAVITLCYKVYKDRDE